MYKVAITENVLEKYLDILPISYYLGEKLEVKVSETLDTYIDLFNRTIYISPNIFEGILLDNEPTEKQLENLIRCALYHEVSHAILTPTALHDLSNNVIDYDLVNIFEDQRIETILGNYYRRVNFPDFVKLVNHYCPDKMPKTPKEFFYQIVRFGEVNSELLNFIKSKQEEYTSRYYYDAPQCYRNNFDFIKYVNDLIDANRFNSLKYVDKFIRNYLSNILRLYNMCERVLKDYQESLPKEEEKENQKENQKDNQKNTQKENQKDNKKEEGLTNTNKENEKDEENEEDEKDEEKIIIVRSPEETKIEEEENEEAQEEQENGSGSEINGPVNETIKSFQNELTKELTRGSSEFYNQLRNTIKMYKAKNKNMGGGCQAYAGKLDPRSFVRDNNQSYKWFIHPNGNQLKKGCKLHLNIFCDTSGSFKNNENKVNDILKELEKVEKEMSDIFEFDVFEVDTDMRKLPKNKRRIYVWGGGTLLNKEWGKIIAKAQDVNNDTLNITLFDGLIYENSRSSSYSNKHLLAIFNKNNFINIIESSNQQGFKQYCKQARKNIIVESTYWNSGNYTAELESNILKVIHSYIQGR